MQSHEIAQILDLVKKRDPAGFELLYQHYFRFLFSVAYSVLNREADSYNVIQSVMLRLYQLDEKLFPTGHELAWLKTVVRNEALMYLRREKATVPLDEQGQVPVLDQRIEDFVDMDAFRDLTASLNERQRKVVSLKILGDLTHREIAQLLSLPTGTVQWLYATSIKQLRRALTGLAAVALACVCGFGYELARHFQTPGGTPGDVGVNSVPGAPALSPWLFLFPALFLLAGATWVLLFKFSDRLPTKRPPRCI